MTTTKNRQRPSSLAWVWIVSCYIIYPIVFISTGVILIELSLNYVRGPIEGYSAEKWNKSFGFNVDADSGSKYRCPLYSQVYLMQQTTTSDNGGSGGGGGVLPVKLSYYVKPGTTYYCAAGWTLGALQILIINFVMIGLVAMDTWRIRAKNSKMNQINFIGLSFAILVICLICWTLVVLFTDGLHSYCNDLEKPLCKQRVKLNATLHNISSSQPAQYTIQTVATLDCFDTYINRPPRCSGAIFSSPDSSIGRMRISMAFSWLAAILATALLLLHVVVGLIFFYEDDANNPISPVSSSSSKDILIVPPKLFRSKQNEKKPQTMSPAEQHLYANPHPRRFSHTSSQRPIISTQDFKEDYSHQAGQREESEERRGGEGEGGEQYEYERARARASRGSRASRGTESVGRDYANNYRQYAASDTSGTGPCSANVSGMAGSAGVAGGRTRSSSSSRDKKSLEQDDALDETVRRPPRRKPQAGGAAISTPHYSNPQSQLAAYGDMSDL